MFPRTMLRLYSLNSLPPAVLEGGLIQMQVGNGSGYDATRYSLTDFGYGTENMTIVPM
jgi:hypothetical protein